LRAVNKDLMGVQVTVILLAWGLCNSFGWLNFREILSRSKIDGILRNIVSSSRNSRSDAVNAYIINRIQQMLIHYTL